MSEWQPIATAPKDSVILVWDGEHVSSAIWTIYHMDGVTGWWVGAVHGKRVESSDYDDGNSPFIDPTHWMPLPEPPA